jgi:hypothetical protein
MDGNSRTRRSIGMVAALILAVGALGIGIASGQTSGNTYTACLKGGTLTKVAIGTEPASPCVGGATPVSWNEQGRDGQDGEDGQDGQNPVETATWTFVYDGNGALDDEAVVSSSNQLQVGDKIRFIRGTVTAPVWPCNDQFTRVQVLVRDTTTAASPDDPEDRQLALGLPTPLGGPMFGDDDEQLTKAVAADGLDVRAFCDFPADDPVPPFTMVLTFEWTHAGPSTTFE